MHRDFLDSILPENEDTLALASHFMGGQEPTVALMLERLREIASDDESLWWNRSEREPRISPGSWPYFEFFGLAYKSDRSYITNYGWLLGADCWIVDFSIGASYRIGSVKLEFALARGVVIASLAIQMRAKGRCDLERFLQETLDPTATKSRDAVWDEGPAE